MSSRAIAILGLILLAASLIFFLFPALDLYTAGMSLELGQTIGAGRLELLRDAGWVIALGGLLLSLALIVMRHRRPGRGPTGFRKALFIVMVLAVGPGLIVNAVLKDNWGRARPHQVVEFGGDKVFTAAWVLSDQCARNCSFVSGEGAFAFALLAPALLIRRRRRVSALALATALGAAVSMVRMAQGAHFLSDSVIGALIVALTAVILHRLILGRDKTGIDEK